MRLQFISYITKTILLAIVFAIQALAYSQQSLAQGAKQPSMCHAIAKAPGPRILKAAFQQTANQFPSVEITYVTHSTFKLVSPDGLSIATDYAGERGKGFIPDVATMNHAHSTHFTAFPNPKIKHVLKGWGEANQPAQHHLKISDVLIRNVPTDIYRHGALVEENGNSIFLFEIAGLCIGHVGHLHHTLTPQHFAEIGRIDVLMIPVDGGLTLSVDGVVDLANQFRSSIIIPMHWFSGWSLETFVAKMRSAFSVDVRQTSAMNVGLDTLPQTPTLIILQPQIARRFDFGD